MEYSKRRFTTKTIKICFHTFVLKQHIDTVNSVNINKESVGMIEFVRQQMNSNDNSYTG